MVPVSSIPWFDLVNVMSYDAIGPTWGRVGDEHAPIAQAERDMALWRARGVPAERLVLSHRTVQNHVQNTLRKLQMNNRVQLTRWAIEHGLDDDQGTG